MARKKPYGIGEWFDIHKFECDTITRDTEGTISAMPHWAGEGVHRIHRVQSAADIVRELSSEAEVILANSQK